MSTGNFAIDIGKYGLRYLDKVLVHESIYSKFLVDNRQTDLDFSELGWVKLLNILFDKLGFYNSTNSFNEVVTANAEYYADYNGNVAEGNRAGYPIGGVTTEWKLYKIRFVRGRQFKFDAIQIQKSGLEKVLPAVVDEFYRLAVVPERDAVFTSIIADCTNTSLGNRVLEAPTTANALSKLLAGENYLFQKGVSASDTVILMSWDFYALLLTSDQWVRYFVVRDFKIKDNDGAEVSLSVTYFNGKPIFIVPNDRFFTDVALTDNGYTTSALSRKLNFMFVSKEYLYPIKRLDTMRVYDDSVITSFAGYIFNFLMWYDLIVPANKRVAIYCSADTNLLGANKNELFVSTIAGETEGTTIINAVFTEPKAINYQKIYYKTTAFDQDVGETEVSGSLCEIGAPFIAGASTLYFVITDNSGTIVAKSGAVSVVVAE